MIRRLIILLLIVGCGDDDGEERTQLLNIYIDGSCEGLFYSAEGTVTEIAGSWVTNPFSIAPLDTLEFELPNAGNYRIYLSTTFNSGEHSGSVYYWDKTITMNEGDWKNQGFICESN